VDGIISSMKKTFPFFFLILILISTMGCLTNSGSTSSSSTTPNSIGSKDTEITNSQFCVGYEGNNQYVTFEPPLVQNTYYKTYGVLAMPLESGKYRITVTTDTPEGIVRVSVTWKKFVGNDKFGNPMYEGVGHSSGVSNRNADFKTEVLIPDSSPGGTIQIFDAQTVHQNHNCGRVNVTRLG
jgi:hypothetical protein